MQVLRAGAPEGRVDGPPYHCDINAMRALFPAARWRVLVPGCGGGYEVVALARAGFDVTALDSAPAARWEWPSPPYPQVPHPRGWAELAVVLTHRNQGF